MPRQKALETATDGAVPLDMRKVMLFGAGGAGFELVGPSIMGLVTRTIRSPALFRNGKPTPRARKILLDNGVDPDGLTPEVAEAINRFNANTGDAAAALRQGEAQSLPVPVTLTSGQATRSPPALIAESRAKKAGDPALLGSQDIQQDALRANVPAIQERLTGQPERIPGQGSQDTQQGLLSRRGAAKAEVDQAFDTARGTDAVFPATTRDDLERGFVQAVEDFDFAALPRAKALVESLDSAVPKGEPVSINGLERWRRRASNARQGAASLEEKKAIGELIRSYDQLVDNQLKRNLLSGDAAAIDAWKNARSLRHRFGQIFEQDDVVNTLTSTMRDGSKRLVVSPDEAVNYIFGRTTLGAKRGLQKDLEKLAQVVGKDSPQWASIREDAFLRLFRADLGGGRAFPAEAFAREMDRAMKEAPEVMRLLFSKNELFTMQQLKRTGTNITRRAQIVGDTNPSGTAAELADRFARQLGPIGNAVRDVVARVLEPVAARGVARRADAAARGTLPPRRAAVPAGLSGVPGAFLGNEIDALANALMSD